MNDTEVWANAPADGEVHHEDHEWILVDLDLSAWAGQSAVQVRWEIESDQYLQFGGWTLDDVCLYEMVAPEEDDGGGEEFGPDGADDLGGEQPPIEAGGCTCGQGAPAGGIAGLWLLLLAVARRAAGQNSFR